MKVLVIEDDREAAKYLIKGLIKHGYSASLAVDGEEGLYLSLHEHYDVLIVDRMLPKRNGLAVVGMLRDAGQGTPVLILSALSDVDERIEGLKAGGDDYLTKPYSFAELIARIEALTRRAQPIAVQDKLELSGLKMDLIRYKVERDGKTIELMPREFQLLSYLMRHSGKVITRTMLLENVWGYNFDPQTNVIDVHISRLRAKIDKGFNKSLLKTIRGVGYKLG